MSVKQVKGTLVECPNGHQFVVPATDWEDEIVEVEDKSEHGMGNEVHHRYSIEDYECPECSKGTDARIDVWEYPEGLIETTDKTDNVVGPIQDAFVANMD